MVPGNQKGHPPMIFLFFSFFVMFELEAINVGLNLLNFVFTDESILVMTSRWCDWQQEYV